MPVTKLTWARVKDHLTRYLWIYILGCVVSVVLSDLLFTMLRPRTPENQIVRFYVAEDYTDTTLLDGYAADILADLQAKGRDILEVEFAALSLADAESDYYSSMLLMVRLAGGEGDVFLCNRYSYEYLLASDAELALDDYLAGGWLDGLDVETETFTSSETGEEHIVAIALRDAGKLRSMGFYSDELYLCVLANGDNLDSTMIAAEDFLRIALE